MKKGFTLVELSIVLIIIGVLVGGILIAQTLINSAAITSTIAQIGRYDAAVGGFTSKYRYLPGDAPGFGGNGDGLIGRYNYWGACTTYTMDTTNLLSGELTNFWSGLYPDQYIPQAYTPNSFTGYTYRDSQFKKRYPHPSIGQKDSFFIGTAVAVSSGYPSWCIDNDAKQNYYVLVSPYNYPKFFGEDGWNTFHNVSAGELSLRVDQMMAFDQKMDDGLPSAGKVIAGSYNGPNSGASKTPSATCSFGTTYLVNNEGFQCMPLFRIGGVSGALR